MRCPVVQRKLLLCPGRRVRFNIPLMFVYLPKEPRSPSFNQNQQVLRPWVCPHHVAINVRRSHWRWQMLAGCAPHGQE